MSEGASFVSGGSLAPVKSVGADAWRSAGRGVPVVGSLHVRWLVCLLAAVATALPLNAIGKER